MSQVKSVSREAEEWQEDRSDATSNTGTAISSNSSASSTATSDKQYQDDPTNLIVNYLPVYFTEDHLRELFASYGQIESLIVMYNKHDYRKKSKGYGFVKFATEEEAKSAIQGVDGTRIGNKTVKVSVARPGRARRASNVFVSRLPVSWRDAELKKAFSTFGHIVECRVLTFADGVSRRCGFVRYDSDEEAKLAMKKMKNFRPSQRDAPLQVNLSVNHSPDARTIAAAEKEMALSGMYSQFRGYRPTARDDYPWSMRQQFMDAMSRREFGHGHSMADEFMYGRTPMMGGFHEPNMIDPLAAHSYGGPNYDPYFHEFNHPGRSPLPGDYRSSSARSNSHSRENYRNSPDTFGSMLRSGSTTGESLHSSSSARGDPTQTRTQSSSGTETSQSGDSPGSKQRLFVQNLPPFYEETHLAQLFSSYGEITGVTIQRDRNGKSINCAFVVFAVAEDAQRATHALDGVMLSTQTLKIHVM